MLHLVFYTHHFIPQRFAAHTCGPVVFIRPEYRGDRGLLEHELVHVGQWWRNPLFGLWYRFSRRFRLQSEVEAFRRQLQYSPDHLEYFAELLCCNYDLAISKQMAKQLLQQ